MNSIQMAVILIVASIALVQCAIVPPTHFANGLEALDDEAAFIRDNYGCDAMVQSCGNKGACCDAHDACYKRHGCTASSWFLLWGNCAACNRDVMGCVATRNPGKSSCCATKKCGQQRP